MQQPPVRLVAVKPHRVYSRQVAVGETYELKPADARLYVALGWSRPADEPVPATMQAAAGTYSRRDMRAEAVPSVDPALLRLKRAELAELAEGLGIAVAQDDTRAMLAEKISQARAGTA